jgi:NAD+ kinase
MTATATTRACRVMLIKKLGCELIGKLETVARYLLHEHNMNVIVEPVVHEELLMHGSTSDKGLESVATFTPDQGTRLGDFVDFVVCLGGDGVLLHAAQLFGEHVPPIIAFHLGSLGFLSQHRRAPCHPRACVASCTCMSVQLHGAHAFSSGRGVS